MCSTSSAAVTLLLEEKLREECRIYVIQNPGQQLPSSSALYKRLQRAQLLHLLDETPAVEPEEGRKVEWSSWTLIWLRTMDFEPAWNSALCIK